MEKPGEPVMPDDFGIGVDGLGQRSQRAGLFQGPMWPVSIEMGLVFGKNHLQVCGIDDEDPVEDLPAQAAHSAFHDRVRPGCLDRCLDDLDALGLEDGIEGAGELGIPVADQEPVATRGRTW